MHSLISHIRKQGRQYGSLIRLGIALGFLLFLAVGAKPPERDHDSVFDNVKVKVFAEGAQKKTDISGVLDAPLHDGRNVIWCGTFQLAWNAACNLAGEDIRFDRPNALIDALNKKTFASNFLDVPSYVALAGFVSDGIYDKINSSLSQTFKGAAAPRMATPKTVQSSHDVVAYAYLFKHLEFATPFEKLDPMDFLGNKVACFGFEKASKAVEPLCAQTLIHDYKTPDDFVIELKSKAADDQLILAKVMPDRNFDVTISNVLTRLLSSPSSAFYSDILKVPKLNYDVTRRYREIEGIRIALKLHPDQNDWIIVQALQNIRFQMDEKGVVLRSESHVSFGCCSTMTPPPKRIMIFNKPFMIVMKRKDSKVPYFAMWVANPELLCR